MTAPLIPGDRVSWYCKHRELQFGTVVQVDTTQDQHTVCVKPDADRPAFWCLPKQLRLHKQAA